MHTMGTGPERSRLKTVGLIVVFSGALVGCGHLSSGKEGVAGAAGVAIAIGAVVCVRGEHIALQAMRARPVGEAEHPALCRAVGELSHELRLPLPTVYVSPLAAPNAFVTGRNPRRAAVCVTRGLLDTLDERELRAVLGHELAHVANRDILASSVGAALASVIVLLADAAARLPGKRRGNRRVHPLAGVLLLVLGPLAGAVIHLAISRSREYAADLTSARLTADPAALASALQKLDAGVRSAPLPPRPALGPAAALMITDPFAERRIGRLFSTHPPTAERVRRLEQLIA